MAFDREKTLRSAQKLIEKRKYDRAILEYQKVVQHDPNDARTLLRIGDLQARLGAHPQAIATYDRVALYYAGRGFSLKAIAVLKQIRELIDRHAPQLADQYSHVSPKLAQTYAELGLISDALATYDSVARRLQNRGRDRDAVEIIRRMVALDRSNPLPYLRLAEALCRVSRLDEAIEHFWSAAQLLTEQGRPEDALKVLERILHFRKDVRVARVAAELYLGRGSREAGLQALSRLQLCFEADPKDLETLTLLARSFDVIGQPAKGVEVYKEMVRIASESGQRELHDRYVAHLIQLAPNDEQVRALAAMQGAPPSQRTAAASEPAPVSEEPLDAIGEDDIEFLEDDSIAPLAPEEGPTRVTPGLAERARSARASAPEIAAERAVPPSRTGAHSDFLKKALVDAESFRGLKLYSKASSALRMALGVAPASIELRAALAEVLLEAGDHPAAIEQMLAVAQLYLDRGSFGAAQAELHQVLDLAPDLPEAVELLNRVSALAPPGSLSRPSAPAADAEVPSEHEAFELRARVSRAPATAQDEEPLPSYQLEDEELEELRPPPVARRVIQAPPDEPLPQFSLDPELNAAPNPPAVAPAPVAHPSGQHSESIQAALDEAEFFSSRGLYQDACMILRDRLDQYPGEAGLIEAIARLEPKLDTESGTRDVGRLSHEDEPEGSIPAIQSIPAVPRLEEEVERSTLARAPLNARFSTEGMLDAKPASEDSDIDLMAALEEAPTEQVDVDEVFAAFKQGVETQISDTDSATHYDLGVAYKEMGLLSDAAREFEVASRDPKRECNCLAMMGMMYQERGELEKAAEAYVRGLNARHKTVAQEVSLYYELGCVYEVKQDVDEAIYYFQRIMQRDPGYRDVSERLEVLMPRSRRFSQPARAINDDDFDRTFDELYEHE